MPPKLIRRSKKKQTRNVALQSQHFADVEDPICQYEFVNAPCEIPNLQGPLQSGSSRNPGIPTTTSTTDLVRKGNRRGRQGQSNPVNANTFIQPTQNISGTEIQGGYQILQIQSSSPPQTGDFSANTYEFLEHFMVDGVGVGDAIDAFRQIKNMIEDAPSQCPEGYEVLLDTENVFVQHADADFAETLFNIRNQYDVLNTYGERIYFSAETLNRLNRLYCGSQTFKLSIISCQGGELFQLKGKNNRAKLYDRKKELIGIISTCYRWCDQYPFYKVMDPQGLLLYQIYHEMGNQNAYDYEVFNKHMEKIGRLSKTWIGLPNPDQELPYSFGISFPIEISVERKALLMSAMFVAYFQYFEDTERERRVINQAWWACIGCTVFLVACMIGIAFLAAYTILN